MFPRSNYRSAFGIGLFFGVIAFGGVLYWIGIFASHIIGPGLALVGWGIAAIAQALAAAFFALGLQWLTTRRSLTPVWLGAPALWVVLEWIRQLGILGTGWGDLAYTQHSYPVVLMETRLTGVWGLSWLIVTVNLGILMAWRRTGRWVYHAGWVLLVAAALTYGIAAQRRLGGGVGKAIIAAALQPDIDQNVRWSGMRPEDPSYTNHVMSVLSEEISQARAQGASLCVAPETFFPGYLADDPVLHAQLTESLRQNDMTLLIGSNQADPVTDMDANSVFAVWPDGSLHGAYMKRQLVPFGEFVPFRQLFPFLEALHVTVFDRKRGPPLQPLLDAGPRIGRAAAAICYESSYPELTREQVRRGANFIVVVTDDTWFGRTAAARQHTAIAAVRAVETDRYVVRSAETGISQIIDPNGKVVSQGALFKPAVVVGEIVPRSTVTFYVRYGDWFVTVCGILGMLAVVSAHVPRRKTDDSPDR